MSPNDQEMDFDWQSKFMEPVSGIDGWSYRSSIIGAQRIWSCWYQCEQITSPSRNAFTIRVHADNRSGCK